MAEKLPVIIDKELQKAGLQPQSKFPSLSVRQSNGGLWQAIFRNEEIHEAGTIQEAVHGLVLEWMAIAQMEIQPMSCFEHTQLPSGITVCKINYLSRGEIWNTLQVGNVPKVYLESSAKVVKYHEYLKNNTDLPSEK